VIWDGKNAAVRDLQSTNGTKVNGKNITEVGIGADTVIQAGRNDYTFRVIAKTLAAGGAA
jgi:pSer/pThr/pTyr-binding forkhead associated (FHA) protein